MEKAEIIKQLEMLQAHARSMDIYLTSLIEKLNTDPVKDKTQKENEFKIELARMIAKREKKRFNK